MDISVIGDVTTLHFFGADFLRSWLLLGSRAPDELGYGRVGRDLGLGLRIIRDLALTHRGISWIARLLVE